ncbi:MAG: cold shock and DUF1294 domain-containing protein [Candidatus Hydrogenedentes bacterium]|nr:cold shock and DUF1294 domain-containing protein [Candidatus Hydrogenedentota bacterium]
MRYQGKLRNWKDEQGFGFITPDGGGGDVFVHIKSFSNRRRRPVANEIVTYELTMDARGRVRAENVRYQEDHLEAMSTMARNTYLPTLAFLFLFIVAGFVVAGKLHFSVLGVYISLSLITFSAYGLDKSAAQNGEWRTSERTLQLLALAGGWPGALIAQKVLRHKSSKRSFQVVFWTTVISNCGALIWLSTSEAASILASFFSAIN